MREGARVVHPVHAFGRILQAPKGPWTDETEIMVRLDNGDTVTTPTDDWEEIELPEGFILELETATEEQLRQELVTVQQLRVYEPGKGQRTKEKNQAKKDDMLAAAFDDDPELKALVERALKGKKGAKKK